MKQYLELADKILRYGHVRKDRTGTGTISVFGPQLAFDLREGFPAVTTKKLALRLIWTELLWMIGGGRSIKPLIEQNNNIWNEWPFERWVQVTGLDPRDFTPEEYEENMKYFKEQILNDPEFEQKYGDLGPVYGNLWRHWPKYYFDGENIHPDGEVDQLQDVINKIRNNPHDRRMVITAWDPGTHDQVALPPCHILFQLYVEEEFIDIKVYQRSADVFLGLPFDIACFATFLTMIAHVTGKVARQLIYTLGDTHIYSNHVNLLLEQLTREPYPLPTLNVNTQDRDIKEIDDFRLEDLSLIDYKHHPKLKGAISV